MSDIVLRARDLSKCYRIGVRAQARKTLRETLTGAISAPARNLGRLRSLTKFDQMNVEADDIIWALKDINFDIEQGDVVGIVGANGAGKSTLLKILSHITEPTTGFVEMRGRASNLLEVGTGFHPELTGRENVYLNASVLGMRKKEIDRKFDEIVDFSGVEKFIDTPVKRYSSGMQVRLAFAVAAHLEPEILIVDEVLAVGDAAFQKKCLGKMSDVAKEGRTVLFVSHNMAAVSRLCGKGILLKQGRSIFSGAISEVIAKYTSSLITSTSEIQFAPDLKKQLQFHSARLLDDKGNGANDMDKARPFRIELEYEVRERIMNAVVIIMLDTIEGVPVWHSLDTDLAEGGVVDREPGFYKAVVEFPGDLLNAGTYQLRFRISRAAIDSIDDTEGFAFTLCDPTRERAGILSVPLEWKTEKLKSLDHV